MNSKTDGVRTGLKNWRFRNAAGTRVVCPGQTLDNAWREEEREREREVEEETKEAAQTLKANMESHVFHSGGILKLEAFRRAWISSNVVRQGG